MSTGVQTILVNGVERPWRMETLFALLGAEGIPAGRPGIAVAVNGQVVPRRQWPERHLEPGDVVEIVGAVAGG